MIMGKSDQMKNDFCGVFKHAVSKLEWSCAGADIPRLLIPTERLWAEGRCPRQLMAWSEMRGRDYMNHQHMRNPSQRDGQAFSPLIVRDALRPEALDRLNPGDMCGE